MLRRKYATSRPTATRSAHVARQREPAKTNRLPPGVENVVGYMSERVAVGLLVAYFLLSIETYLATYTVGKVSSLCRGVQPHGAAAAAHRRNIALFFKPVSIIFGRQYLMFDVGGTVGIIAWGSAAVVDRAAHPLPLPRRTPLVK